MWNYQSFLQHRPVLGAGLSSRGPFENSPFLNVGNQQTTSVYHQWAPVPSLPEPYVPFNITMQNPNFGTLPPSHSFPSAHQYDFPTQWDGLATGSSNTLGWLPMESYSNFDPPVTPQEGEMLRDVQSNPMSTGNSSGVTSSRSTRRRSQAQRR
ncbi:hypothetical protein G7054_g8254 [Neopestalotiopsis clavispora]|nr:hypothetical protein G7054_g8254 [Neopestalotiopsis clavispora]